MNYAAQMLFTGYSRQITIKPDFLFVYAVVIATLLIVPFKAAAQNQSLSGNITAGVQHQTNAVFGPDSLFIRLHGDDFPRDPSLAPDEDYNLFVNGIVFYKNNLDPQGSNVLNLLLNGTVQRYDKNKNLNYSSLGGKFGIDINNLFGGSTNKIKPFITLSKGLTNTGSDSYRYGAGIDYQHRITNRFIMFGNFSFEKNDISSESARDININRARVGINSLYLSSPDLSVNFSAYYNNYNSGDIFNNYGGLEIAAGFNRRYSPPVAAYRKWNLSVVLLYLNNEYKEVKPNIDPDVIRVDERWNIYLTNTIPIINSWSFVQSIKYTHANSNLPNFDYDNLGISLAVKWAF